MSKLNIEQERQEFAATKRPHEQSDDGAFETWCRAKIAAKHASMEGEPVADTPRLRTVINFLLGEGPLDGFWYGDEYAQRRGKSPGPYWWRAELRELASAPPSTDAIEALKAAHVIVAYAASGMTHSSDMTNLAKQVLNQVDAAIAAKEPK